MSAIESQINKNVSEELNETRLQKTMKSRLYVMDSHLHSVQIHQC